MSLKNSPKGLRFTTRSGARYQLSTPDADGYRTVLRNGAAPEEFRRAKILGPGYGHAFGVTYDAEQDLRPGTGVVLQPEGIQDLVWASTPINEIEEE